jgi:hypothetical protein
MVDVRATSVAIRKARTNSRAVDASRPLVELEKDTVSTVGRSELRKALLVPSCDRGTKRESLADGNTLFLAARHASNGSIADGSIFDMAQAKDRLNDVGYTRHIIAT